MKSSALWTGIVVLILAAPVSVSAKDKPKPATKGQNKAQGQTPAKGKSGKSASNNKAKKDKGHKDKGHKDKGHKDKGHKDKGHKESQEKSNAQLMQAFKVLQATKITLEKGDHDYGGHRALAVQAIAHAQGSLGHALASQKMKTPPAPNLKNWKREPQKVSNAQLANSVKVLHKTIVALRGANHDYHGMRGRAIEDLERAAHQLEVALKYQKKHGF
jgi:hypothetical protein